MSESINERIARVKGLEPEDGGLAEGWIDRSGKFLGAKDWSGFMGDAWELVEEIQATGRNVLIGSPHPGYRTWDVRGWNDKENNGRYIAHALTAPEAICLAWLAVMEGEEIKDD